MVSLFPLYPLKYAGTAVLTFSFRSTSTFTRVSEFSFVWITGVCDSTGIMYRWNEVQGEEKKHTSRRLKRVKANWKSSTVIFVIFYHGIDHGQGLTMVSGMQIVRFEKRYIYCELCFKLKHRRFPAPLSFPSDLYWNLYLCPPPLCLGFGKINSSGKENLSIADFRRDEY